MSVLRYYSMFSQVNRELLRQVANRSPFLKWNKGGDTTTLEIDLITSANSKKSEGAKTLMDELTARNFHFSKSIATNKYRYNLYNMAIVYLFVSKIEALSGCPCDSENEVAYVSPMEALFWHLNDEFLAQGESTSGFFEFFM